MDTIIEVGRNYRRFNNKGRCHNYFNTTNVRLYLFISDNFVMLNSNLFHLFSIRDLNYIFMKQYNNDQAVTRYLYAYIHQKCVILT